MGDDATVQESDQGKRVVNADGETIGVVSGVRSGRAYVDPDPGMKDHLMAKLGLESVDTEDYPLPERSVAAVTDDEVRLRRDQ